MLVVLLLLLALLATACSGGDEASSAGGGDTAGEHAGGGEPEQAGAGSAGGGGAAPGPGADGAGDGDTAGGGTAGGTAGGAPGVSTANRISPDRREIIYEALLTVRVGDVGAATRAAERQVVQAGGLVFGEQTFSDPAYEEEAQTTLVLKVPPAGFRSLLEDLAGLGERISQEQSAQDVTGQVVDLESRIASQRESVARLRALLTQAEQIADIVTIEAELAERQAELESLEGRLALLSDRTELATVTLTLVGPAAEVAEDDEALGFLAGLANGWEAFTTSFAVALTVLGALLPFAVTAAAVGLPLWLLLRARRRTRSPAPEPTV